VISARTDLLWQARQCRISTICSPSRRSPWRFYPLRRPPHRSARPLRLARGSWCSFPRTIGRPSGLALATRRPRGTPTGSPTAQLPDDPPPQPSRPQSEHSGLMPRGAGQRFGGKCPSGDPWAHARLYLLLPARNATTMQCHAGSSRKIPPRVPLSTLPPLRIATAREWSVPSFKAPAAATAPLGSDTRRASTAISRTV
jgi:hypothetical protein